MRKIIELIELDELRLKALECVRLLDLPQCYLAAGFVRNLVWDSLHQKTEPTKLNDVDVIYFDSHESDGEVCKQYELRLEAMLPELKWQVRNQALMHIRNRDKPYTSSLDAMRHWPEKETAVGIRKVSDGTLECISAFGYESLFNLQLTHNPKRSKSIFDYRVNSKGWLSKWKGLKITL
ncbi:nucleotidyltransferase family protein [Paraglaciecola sp.]|uniref:nucleotidyltransferase family protein n=1 Tax=Paraglaciecola sp. TaxID=1920173 RepID=UPI00326543F1